MNLSGENFHSLKIVSRDFTLRQNASQHLRSMISTVQCTVNGQWPVASVHSDGDDDGDTGNKMYNAFFNQCFCDCYAI